MEKVTPLISVIVPNYNHEKYLKERLNSIFNQTYSNFEVILLDDCSTDKSREILSEYSKNERVSHCIFNEINLGNTFKQWIKGIGLAKGDFIWIAESDDFCDNNFLEKLIEPFQNDAELALVYCQSNRVNELGEVTGSWITHTNNLEKTLFLDDFCINGNKFIQDFLIYKNVIPNASGVVFRKKNAVQIGHLDLDPVLKTCGDWLFYVKLLANSKVAYIHKSLNNFRYHSESVISNSLRANERTSIIDIELITRKKIISFLLNRNIDNLSIIRNQNYQITRNLKYEKGLLYINNDEKIRGGLILATIFFYFIKKYKFQKKFKMKILNFLK